MALKIIPGCYLLLSINVLLLIKLHLVCKTCFLLKLECVNGVLAGPRQGSGRWQVSRRGWFAHNGFALGMTVPPLNSLVQEVMLDTECVQRA